MGHGHGEGPAPVPRVIVTAGAVRGLERCRQFLSARNPDASRRAARVIAAHFQGLERVADIGRPVGPDSDLRELIIPFGNSGYVALYRVDRAARCVYILAVRHQREAGY